jgi:hypothetical protein
MLFRISKTDATAIHSPYYSLLLVRSFSWRREMTLPKKRSTSKSLRKHKNSLLPVLLLYTRTKLKTLAKCATNYAWFLISMGAPFEGPLKETIIGKWTSFNMWLRSKNSTRWRAEKSNRKRREREQRERERRKDAGTLLPSFLLQELFIYFSSIFFCSFHSSSRIFALWAF